MWLFFSVTLHLVFQSLTHMYVLTSGSGLMSICKYILVYILTEMIEATFKIISLLTILQPTITASKFQRNLMTTKLFCSPTSYPQHGMEMNWVASARVTMLPSGVLVQVNIKTKI